MSDYKECQYCKQSDKDVLEYWIIDRWNKQVKHAFYAHQKCLNKELSTEGDGHGVRFTA